MRPRWIRPLLLLLAVIILSGVFVAMSQHEVAAKLDIARQGALGCIMYVGNHDGQYPSDLSAIATYTSTNFINQFGASFELVYTGAATNIAKPTDTIIIREKKAWEQTGNRWAKTYAFADGHAEVHVSDNGNFEDWEKERMVRP